MLKIERSIGSGTFGEVYAVKNNNGSKFALKTFRYTHLMKEDQIKRAKILPTLNHTNIVKFFNVAYFVQKDEHFIEVSSSSVEEKLFGLVMELCQRDLRDCIRTRTSVKDKWNRKILLQICDGVNYLHDKNIVHRDLKPENILMIDDHVKLADFDDAKGGVSHVDQSHSSGKGTLLYMAPEVREGKRYSKNVDIYSLGVVLLELYSETASFREWVNTLDRAKIEYDTKVYIEECFMPDHLWILVEKMTKEPKNRPEISEVKTALKKN